MYYRSGFTDQVGVLMVVIFSPRKEQLQSGSDKRFIGP
jgi:hypothetical protein